MTLCAHTPALVYFVENAHADAVKIGIAEDPKRRLRTLRAMSPTPLVLLATIPGCILDEQALHDVLVGYRIHGEWFQGHAGRCIAGLALKMDPDAFWAWVRESRHDEPRVGGERAA